MKMNSVFLFKKRTYYVTSTACHKLKQNFFIYNWNYISNIRVAIKYNWWYKNIYIFLSSRILPSIICLISNEDRLGKARKH